MQTMAKEDNAKYRPNNPNGARPRECVFTNQDLDPTKTRQRIMERAGKIIWSELGRQAGISHEQARRWSQGEPVTARVDARIRKALDMPENPAAQHEDASGRHHYREYLEAQEREIAARPRKRGPYRKTVAA